MSKNNDVDFAALRLCVYKLLKKLTFSVVTMPVKYGDEHKKFYFTHSQTIDATLQKAGRSRTQTVWVKKPARSRSGVILGPLILSDQSTIPPEVGNVLVGELSTKIQGCTKTLFGSAAKVMSGIRPRDAGSRCAYKWWINDAFALQTFFEMLVGGSTTQEVDCRSLLAQSDGYDDIYALCRVVLFKNIECVAKQADPDCTGQEKMRLKFNPIMFMHNLSKCCPPEVADPLIAAFRKHLPPFQPATTPITDYDAPIQVTGEFLSGVDSILKSIGIGGQLPPPPNSGSFKSLQTEFDTHEPYPKFHPSSPKYTPTESPRFYPSSPKYTPQSSPKYYPQSPSEYMQHASHEYYPPPPPQYYPPPPSYPHPDSMCDNEYNPDDPNY